MMKNIFNLIFIVAVAIIFSSCDDFLDKSPLSEMTDDSLGINGGDGGDSGYTTAESAEQLLKASYQSFRSEYFQLDRMVFNAVLSGNAYVGADGSDSKQLENYAVEAANGIVGRDWKYLYSMVSRTNLILNNVPDIDDTFSSPTRKDEILGEAAFTRAFAYFDLVRLYGDIPLLLKEIKTISSENIEVVYPDLYPSRTSIESVYAQIVIDIQMAVTKCKDFSNDKNIITKNTAKALLAKVYATMPNPNWATVSDLCSEVISKHPLVDNYNDLFDDLHKDSSEALLEIFYDGNKASDTSNWAAWAFIGFDWKRYNVPSVDIIGDFNANQTDSRLAASVLFHDVTGMWGDQYWGDLTKFPFAYKIRDYNSSASNIIIMRSADVVLLKAEAQNQMGNTSVAWDLVNQIRTRAKIALLPEADKVNKAKMLENILNERRLELAFEGYFWFDLLRFGKAIEWVDSQKDSQGNLISKGKLSENELLFPIPQAERMLNSNLTQNPGY